MDIFRLFAAKTNWKRTSVLILRWEFSGKISSYMPGTCSTGTKPYSWPGTLRIFGELVQKLRRKSVWTPKNAECPRYVQYSMNSKRSLCHDIYSSLALIMMWHNGAVPSPPAVMTPHANAMRTIKGCLPSRNGGLWLCCRGPSIKRLTLKVLVVLWLTFSKWHSIKKLNSRRSRLAA